MILCAVGLFTSSLLSRSRSLDGVGMGQDEHVVETDEGSSGQTVESADARSGKFENVGVGVGDARVTVDVSEAGIATATKQSRGEQPGQGPASGTRSRGAVFGERNVTADSPVELLAMRVALLIRPMMPFAFAGSMTPEFAVDHAVTALTVVAWCRADGAKNSLTCGRASSWKPTRLQWRSSSAYRSLVSA